MIAVADLGAVLRWVGLLGGPAPPLRRMVSADALLGEIVEYLKTRFEDRPELVASTLTEIQFSVHEWYPTWPVAGRLAALATTTGVELDATLLTPVVVAAETGLPLATTSEEIADLARPHVPAVVLV
ncbi:MAG TPA: hypothetical protein VGQ80_12940 [Acidimicrobiia bacterium]|nr:hypothetical protein [Acidimicrobiia bacterium]